MPQYCAVSTQFHICTLDREKFNVFDRNSGFFNAFFLNGKYEANMAVLNVNRKKLSMNALEADTYIKCVLLIFCFVQFQIFAVA
jgi:hypothetical protein